MEVYQCSVEVYLYIAKACLFIVIVFLCTVKVFLCMLDTYVHTHLLCHSFVPACVLPLLHVTYEQIFAWKSLSQNRQVPLADLSQKNYF